MGNIWWETCFHRRITYYRPNMIFHHCCMLDWLCFFASEKQNSEEKRRKRLRPFFTNQKYPWCGFSSEHFHQIASSSRTLLWQPDLAAVCLAPIAPLVVSVPAPATVKASPICQPGTHNHYYPQFLVKALSIHVVFPLRYDPSSSPPPVFTFPYYEMWKSWPSGKLQVRFCGEMPE